MFRTAHTMTASPVTVSYEDLLERPETLEGAISSALGSGEGALGVILISGEFAIFFPPPS